MVCPGGRCSSIPKFGLIQERWVPGNAPVLWCLHSVWKPRLLTEAGHRPVLHLADELLDFDLGDVLARHHHQAHVPRAHVRRKITASCFCRGLCYLLLGRLSVFMRKGKHDIAILPRISERPKRNELCGPNSRHQYT